MPMGLQEIYEHQGFIVLAYLDPAELAHDDACGFAENIEGSLNGFKVRLAGPATREEWDAQEKLSGDWESPRKKYVGFRKVVSE